MKRTNTWLAWALVVGLLAFMLGSATAGRGVVDQPEPVVGYATGTPVHLDALQAAATGPRLADVELAFSSANVNSNGFGATSGLNENGIEMQPAADRFSPPREFPGKQASARGSGLLLGLGTDVPTTGGNVLDATNVGALVSPPPSDSDAADVVPGTALGPIAYAELLHSEAAATWTGFPCANILSSPISFGRGYAADAQLLNTGGTNPDDSFQGPVVATDDPAPERSVVQSRSFMYAQANGDPGRFGLVSEVHQTFAPVSLARGPLPPLVIEVLGEWVFRATATGKAGGAKVERFVLNEAGELMSDTTPVIRISQNGGGTFTSIALQDILPTDGLIVPIDPLLSLAVGEDPRRVSAPNAVPDPTSDPIETGDGRSASGALDVIRLDALDVGTAPLTAETHLADLRIGHFEATASVPPGGFSCTADTTTSSSTTSSSTSSSSTSTSTSSTSTSTTSSTTTTTSPTPSTSTTSSSTTTSSTTSSSTTSTTVASGTTSSSSSTTSSTTSTTAPRAVAADAVNRQPNTVG